MAKFVKLTNDNSTHKGSPIYFNIDHITAVFDAPVQQGGSLKTFVFNGHSGIQWEVEESPKEVVNKIESLKHDS